MIVDVIIPHSLSAKVFLVQMVLLMIVRKQKNPKQNQLSWAIDQLTSCTIAGHSREFLCREASMDRLPELATSQHLINKVVKKDFLDMGGHF